MSARVSAWMTPEPQTIEPGASALAALDLMLSGGYRHLPVVDRSRTLVGILTLSDLRSALDEPLSLRGTPSPAERELARDYSVAELMSHAPATTAPDAPLEQAARQMAARRIGCLPVVTAGGALVGLLSETDALHALVVLLVGEPVGRRAERPGRLDAVEHRLRSERWRILQRLSALAEEERLAAEERQEVVLDSAERASEQQGAELAEGVAELSVRRLAALDRALERAARGRLGICEACGGSIPPDRVRALPGTSLCVRCAREREQGVERPLAPALPAARMSSDIGRSVHTPQGEGRLLRIAVFGTCGECGEVEGRYDEEEDAVLCSSPECGLPLEDTVELAVVEVADEIISVPPEKLGGVDPQPFD